MPAPAVKPEVPPKELMDRTEGWGMFGRILGYPEFKDDGTWPPLPAHLTLFRVWPTETNDDRDNGWTHEVLIQVIEDEE